MYNFIIFTSLWEIIHDCNKNSTDNTATLNHNNKPFIPSINRKGGGQLSIYKCTPSNENFEKSIPKTKYMYTNLANSMKVVINFMFLFSKSYSLPPPLLHHSLQNFENHWYIKGLHIKYMACSLYNHTDRTWRECWLVLDYFHQIMIRLHRACFLYINY